MKKFSFKAYEDYVRAVKVIIRNVGSIEEDQRFDLLLKNLLAITNSINSVEPIHKTSDILKWIFRKDKYSGWNFLYRHLFSISGIQCKCFVYLSSIYILRLSVPFPKKCVTDEETHY